MSWVESERQLYGMVVADPSRYEQVILAVRAMADEMHEVASTAQLAAMWPSAPDLFVSVMARLGLPAQTLPREHVMRAAFALRERELREQILRQVRRGCIDAARQGGDAWAVLDEAGTLEAGLVDPYRCTEMYVASGLAVISQVQPDVERGVSLFVLSVVRLDPLSGELLDATPGIEDWTGHACCEDYLVHRRTLRERIASMLVSDAKGST
ncbi:hypothetical protein WQE_13791 [Paraburkholderia hospita]|uniref:Uncharacterized protein n=2 Tax=Paraburkholderia hospita TaxID=169430 RepID=A0ABP2PVK0_9BURK|nr:hypothetical protein WQE_13791 [Paraburkholderia hospita]